MTRRLPSKCESYASLSANMATAQASVAGRKLIVIISFRRLTHWTVTGFGAINSA
jgi:hypothetical protein